MLFGKVDAGWGTAQSPVCDILFAFTAAWSQNVDSAASMYAPSTLPLTLDLAWGEDYQDLSSWCSKLQPETAADTEGSGCTALDDELNTPEVGT
jgi:hypothetical protein